MSETSDSKAQTTEILVGKMDILPENETNLKESVALLIPINRKEERRNTLSTSPVPDPLIPQQNINV